jgi:hypothetical protein
MATDVSIEGAVLDALRSDPRIPHPEEVAVTFDEEGVTLRGPSATSASAARLRGMLARSTVLVASMTSSPSGS